MDSRRKLSRVAPLLLLAALLLLPGCATSPSIARAEVSADTLFPIAKARALEYAPAAYVTVVAAWEAANSTCPQPPVHRLPCQASPLAGGSLAMDDPAPGN